MTVEFPVDIVYSLPGFYVGVEVVNRLNEKRFLEFPVLEDLLPLTLVIELHMFQMLVSCKSDQCLRLFTYFDIKYSSASF